MSGSWWRRGTRSPSNGNDATLDDIARRAAVGPGTLYRHFPDRETLLAAVYRDEILALCARTDALAETLPPDEALAAWLRLQLDYITAKRGLGAAVKTMLGIDSETVNFCKDTMRAAVGRLLSRAQEAGVVRMDIAPADLLRLVHGVGTASETDPSSADRLLSYVLDGIRPQRAPGISPGGDATCRRMPSAHPPGTPALGALPGAVSRTSACVRPSGMPSAPSDSPSTHTRRVRQHRRGQPTAGRAAHRRRLRSVGRRRARCR